jgi:hypothetical protein
MPCQARQATLKRPAPVTIHDDGNMLRWINYFGQVYFLFGHGLIAGVRAVAYDE